MAVSPACSADYDCVFCIHHVKYIKSKLTTEEENPLKSVNNAYVSKVLREVSFFVGYVKKRRKLFIKF